MFTKEAHVITPYTSSDFFPRAKRHGDILSSLIRELKFSKICTVDANSQSRVHSWNGDCKVLVLVHLLNRT